MDLQLMLEHLAEAERHVTLSDQHIARQIEIIDGLERAGCSTELAIDILATYRALRSTHVAHLDLIRKELKGTVRL